MRDELPAGSLASRSESDGVVNTLAYGGIDHLVSAVRTGSVPFSHAYTYGHNRNRLTQTRGGSVVQSFAYDGHDKLLSGNAGGETYSYDADGNQTGLNYYGSFYTFTWDDEDRLTGVTGSNGLNDAFLYNGLGQRTAKNDSTGQYALVSDGASPAAPVLADGLTVYTPGLSSRKNGYSEFRHGDLLGSLRFLTDANQNVVGDRLFSAFGATVASDGDPSTPFGWVGDGESQTDTGLVLMGHRVYDSRLGRFLSQDPAGAGGNWYAYADNDPINEDDPSGLISQTTNGGNGWMTWGQLQDAEQGLDPGTYNIYSKQSGQSGDGTFLKTITISAALNAAFSSTSGPMMGAGPAGMGGRGSSGRFAAGNAQGSVTTPQGIEAVAQLQEDGITVGKQGLNPLKEAARQSLRSLKLTEEQVASAQRAISRATASSKIAIKKEMENLIINVTRPGRVGYQNFEHTINPAGDKTVIQKAFDELGNLVHYDPKTP